jgi:glycosyltransferase involved in cell wall biosynthesis
MSNLFQIGVIIATSFQRTDLLFNRALKSVMNQAYPPDFTVIIDDNQNEGEFEIIKSKLKDINIPNICCIRNFKTKHYSGTGAWNSGADFLREKFQDTKTAYLAFLDDDDEWAATYLKKCAEQIKVHGVEKTKAVFANIVRLHKDRNIYFELTKENLTVKNFLHGNPGVQGSNTFFNFEAFMDIGGFDEGLKSCNDRDIMTRFLIYHSIENIALVNETLVYCYAQSRVAVTEIPSIKWEGLDKFYDKYINLYTADLLEESLKRAENLFNYPNRNLVLDKYRQRFL